MSVAIYLWPSFDGHDLHIVAGCRHFFGIAAARSHWKARHLDDPILHADCLSLVDRIDTMARARGWIEQEEEVCTD